MTHPFMSFKHTLSMSFYYTSILYYNPTQDLHSCSIWVLFLLNRAIVESLTPQIAAFSAFDFDSSYFSLISKYEANRFPLFLIILFVDSSMVFNRSGSIQKPLSSFSLFNVSSGQSDTNILSAILVKIEMFSGVGSKTPSGIFTTEARKEHIW